MEVFFAEYQYFGAGAGAGAWSVRLALDIVENNIVWVIDREDAIINGLLTAIPTTTTTRITTIRTTTPTTTSTNIYDNIRLPNFLKPNNYTLTLRTYFEPETRMSNTKAIDNTGFDGNVIIDFNINQTTNELLFHCYRDLQILDPIIIQSDTETITITNEIHEHVKNDFYYIKLNKMLSIGRYTINLKYKANYKSLFGNTGLFANSYKEDNKIK